MIEWKICSNCNTIIFEECGLICPECGGSIKVYDLDFIRDYFSKLTFLLDSIDNLELSAMKDYLPLMYDWKNQGFSLKTALVDDLLNWLIYLADSDGVFSDEELEFINYVFEVNFTGSDLANLKKNPEELPQSFKFLYEQDQFNRYMGNETMEFSEFLYELYTFFGKFFVSVNGYLDDNAFTSYTEFMDNLRKNFDEYKLQKPEITVEESNEPDLNTYLEELNRLVGLENVKKDVNSLINLIQIRKIRESRGLKQPQMSLHLVFSGNPGTGKTTVARILANIYKAMGILSQGHLVETDRSGLVGGYVGQTAIKTQEMIQKAMGGILFIDEAYALTSKSENDYGSEAIDTILKAMEDNRGDFIVIVAGYTELMDNFLKSNPGLESRFNKFIDFQDYSSEELCEIFKVMCEDSSLTLDAGGEEYITQYFDKLVRNKPANFANARSVRNLFEQVLTSQANRLVEIENITDEQLNTLTYEDFLID